MLGSFTLLPLASEAKPGLLLAPGEAQPSRHPHEKLSDRSVQQEEDV
jgi:hypothetical protein